MLLAVLAAGACTGPAPGSGEADGSTETGGTDDGMVPAGAVSIARIELNPAVPIPIWEDGESVSPDRRNAKIPAGRPALVRVHVEVDAEWTPRDVTARLYLGDGSGNEGERELVRAIAGDSQPADPSTTFDFLLESSEVGPGLELAVELVDEHGPDGGDPARVPENGRAVVGVAADPVRVRVMLVPIAYDSGGCVSVGHPDEDYAARIGEALFQTFPVQEIVLFERPDPVAWSSPLGGNWGGLLQKLIELRASDGVADDVIYLGVVDLCDETPPVTAVAAGIPAPVPEDAAKRVGISALYPTPDGNGGIADILFSVAVLSGRPTVACAMGQGIDDGYPYSDGTIGGWGFGVLDGELRAPDEHLDLVAGCLARDRWVSDYTFTGLYERIRLITQWAG